MNTRIFSSAIVLSCLALGSAVHAQHSADDQKAAEPKAAAAETKDVLSESDFTVTANGTIGLDVAKHSPIYAEFDGSPALSDRLRASLKDLGMTLAQDKASAKASLLFKGDLVLLGGPKFYKGAKVSVGNATEKALKDANGQTRTADVVGGAAGLALNGAAFAGAMNNFTRGLAISGMVNALGDAGGMRSWFNTAVAGDPRGVCLSRCNEWNKVKQTVYLSATLEWDGKKDEVRILTNAFSETVAPDQVVTFAVGKAIEQIKVAGVREGGQTVGLVQEKQ